jgi:small subunit ribosomal protein S13
MTKVIQFFNIQLLLNSKLNISLTKIFGISLSKANIICEKFGFNKNSLVRDVDFQMFNELRKFILVSYSVEQNLRKVRRDSIENLILSKTVKGFRHRLHLPVRGQRTRSNHKTQKRLI